MRQREGDFTMRVYCGFDLAWKVLLYTWNSEAVFGLFTMENGISKIILPKEP